MKNIFVLPTDKPSRLVKIKDTFFLTSTDDIPGGTFYNIYIINNEKIEEVDWFLNIKSGAIGQHNGVEILLFKDDRKIILTTDPELIKDGVQEIDDEFLEWFVNNPSCEEVEVVVENYEDNEWIGDDWGGEIYTFEYERYKIIIPKEESKKPSNFYEKLKEYFKTTPREKVLEDWNKSAHLDNVGPAVDEFIENSNEERLKETAKRLYEYQSQNPPYTIITPKAKIEGFIEGVKSDVARDYWFEKFEEDLRTAYFSGIKTTGEGRNGEYVNGNNPSIEEEFQEEFQEWFEQYKKK